MTNNILFRKVDREEIRRERAATRQARRLAKSDARKRKREAESAPR